MDLKLLGLELYASQDATTHRYHATPSHVWLSTSTSLTYTLSSIPHHIHSDTQRHFQSFKASTIGVSVRLSNCSLKNNVKLECGFTKYTYNSTYFQALHKITSTSYNCAKHPRNKKKRKQIKSRDKLKHTQSRLGTDANYPIKPNITLMWFITIKHGTVRLFQRLSWRGAFNTSCFQWGAVRAPQGTELGGCQRRILHRPVSACPWERHMAV